MFSILVRGILCGVPHDDMVLQQRLGFYIPDTPSMEYLPTFTISQMWVDLLVLWMIWLYYSMKFRGWNANSQQLTTCHYS